MLVLRLIGSGEVRTGAECVGSLVTRMDTSIPGLDCCGRVCRFA
jgi:hypothetical protein